MCESPAETKLYYLQSRYYDPALKRFLNADTLASTGQGVLGTNMFSFCLNNPLSLSDYNGHDPEWWQWLISGAMVVAGAALIATGIGGIAGGALICAGANSIIGSYVSEATGGSATAGWVGGTITGIVCGLGAGFGGSLILAASDAVNAECMGLLAGGIGLSSISGFGGAALGRIVSDSIDGNPIIMKEVVTASVPYAAFNCLASLSSGIGGAIHSMPAISSTTANCAKALASGWSIISEAVVDLFETVMSLF